MAKSSSYMKRNNTGNSKTQLSMEEKEKITNDIKTHSTSDNDKAERNMERSIKREKIIVDNFEKYKRTKLITGRNDPWFAGHENSLKILTEKLNFFREQRKKLKKEKTIKNRKIALEQNTH